MLSQPWTTVDDRYIYIYILHDLRTLEYGNFGIFFIMGNAGLVSLTLKPPKDPLKEPLKGTLSIPLKEPLDFYHQP